MRKALADKLARGKNVQLVGTITTSTSTEISLLLPLDEASVALADFGRVMGQTSNTDKNCKKEFIRICRGKARFYTSISMSRWMRLRYRRNRKTGNSLIKKRSFPMV